MLTGSPLLYNIYAFFIFILIDAGAKPSEARRSEASAPAFANHHINVLFIPSALNHLDLHTVCECFIIFSPQLQSAHLHSLNSVLYLYRLGQDVSG